MRQTLTTLLGILPLFLFAQINDCNLAIIVCDNLAISSNPQGPGNDDFFLPTNNAGCLIEQEHQSEWYYFELDPASPPDLELGFTVTPNGGVGEDYDFAIFGPNVNCLTLGDPIRCSYAAPGCAFCPTTGLGMGMIDLSEDANGDGFLAPLTVQPGEGYFILIDNFQGNFSGFNMQWTGSGAGWLNCSATLPCNIAAFAGNDIDLCEGSSNVPINGSGLSAPGANLSYTWESPNNGLTYIDNPNVPVPTLNFPPNYSGVLDFSLTVSDGTCSHTDETTVTVYPLPEVIMPLSQSLCKNDPPIQLSASPEGGVWGNTAPNGTLDPALLAAGNYNVDYTFTDNNNCSVTEYVEVNILPIPSLTFAQVPVTCLNDAPFNLVVTPTGGTWSNNVPDGIVYPMNFSIGFHSLIYTYGDPNTGCTTSISREMEVVTPPPVDIEGPEVFCLGETIDLSAPGYIGWIWSDNSTESSISVSTSGTYSVTTTINNGCTSSGEITVLADDNYPTANAGEDQFLDCQGNPVALGSDSSSIGANISYNWTSPIGNTIFNQNDLNALINQAGTYVLQVTNTYNSCTATDEIVILENNESPTDATITITPNVCYGDSMGSILITNVVGGTSPYTFSLDGNNFNDSNEFQFLQSGIYPITVLDNHGCMYQTTAEVIDPPEFFIDLGEDILINLGDEALLSVESSYPLLSFSWDAHETILCPTCEEQTVAPLFTTQYSAIGVNEFGCVDQDEIIVDVERIRRLYVPNAFSPNDDGWNDLLSVYGGIDVVKINEFKIYNRWGEAIYEAYDFLPNDDNTGWDGYFRGKKMKTGVFVYFVEATFLDGETEIFKGDVTLME